MLTMRLLDETDWVPGRGLSVFVCCLWFGGRDSRIVLGDDCLSPLDHAAPARPIGPPGATSSLLDRELRAFLSCLSRRPRQLSLRRFWALGPRAEGVLIGPPRPRAAEYQHPLAASYYCSARSTPAHRWCADLARDGGCSADGLPGGAGGAGCPDGLIEPPLGGAGGYSGPGNLGQRGGRGDVGFAPDLDGEFADVIPGQVDQSSLVVSGVDPAITAHAASIV